MQTIVITVGTISGLTGILAFLLTLAKNTIGNYGEVVININNDEDHVVDGGDTLLSSLISEKIFIPSACGGKGSCGYCKVKVTEGGGPVLPTELGYLTPEDMKENVRLSCQVKVKDDIKIEIPEELFSVAEYEGKVSSIVDLTPAIKHLTFDIREGSIDFKPGQYVQLRAPQYEGSDEEVYRAYSVASSPLLKNKIELLIGYVPEGVATTYVHHHLHEDEEVLFNGPYGDFFYQDTDREMLMIAIGTGMAPILSILLYMAENNIDRKATFYFGARNVEDLFLLDEIRQIEEKLPNFKFVPTLSRAKREDGWGGEIGRVTDAIEKFVENGENKEAYLCGSPRMIDSTIEKLKEKGIPEEFIFYDKFE